MRSLAALPVVAAALALAPPASAPPPERGLFVPGGALGGVQVGMTKRQVRDVWGSRYGVCSGCPRTTWYFNYRPFEPQGAGVVFRRGRVSHVFTLWRPEGWRTVDGLELGADESEVGEGFVILEERRCAGYTAIVASGASALPVFYVYEDRLWGFGLIAPSENPCL